jgi:hypothetical protein
LWLATDIVGRKTSRFLRWLGRAAKVEQFG